VKYSNLDDYLKIDPTSLPYIFGNGFIFEIYFVLYGERISIICPRFKEISKKLRPFLATYGTKGSTSETRSIEFQKIFGFSLDLIPKKLANPDFFLSAIITNQSWILSHLNDFIKDFKIATSPEINRLIRLAFSESVQRVNKDKSQPCFTQPEFSWFILVLLACSLEAESSEVKKFSKYISEIYAKTEMVKRVA